MYLPANPAVSTYLAARRATVAPDHVRCYSHHPVVYLPECLDCHQPLRSNDCHQLTPPNPGQVESTWTSSPLLLSSQLHRFFSHCRDFGTHEIFHPRPSRLLVFLPVVWDYSTSRQSRDLRVLCEFNYWEHETNNTSRALHRILARTT